MADECRVARLIPLEKFHFDVTVLVTLSLSPPPEKEGEKSGIEGKRYDRSREVGKEG